MPISRKPGAVSLNADAVPVRVMIGERTIHNVGNGRVSERIKTWQSGKGRYVSVHSLLLRTRSSGLLLLGAVKVIIAFLEIFRTLRGVRPLSVLACESFLPKLQRSHNPDSLSAFNNFAISASIAV